MQILLENLVVGLADLLDELLAIVLRLVQHVGRNVADDVVRAQGLIFIGNRLHPDEIDHPDEFVLGADGELNRDRIAFQLGDDLVERPLEVRPDAVHLVDETDARHAIFVGLPPDGLRLRLDARHRIEHRDSAVEHAKRPLDFRREINMARRIDDIDPVIAPETRRRRGRDRDAALLFLLHPVHHGSPLVDLTELVGDAGVEEDALGRRGLAGIDVRHDADVARFR